MNRYTLDEVEFVMSKIGMYTISSIAKKLNRTRDSVCGLLVKHHILSFDKRNNNGITPRQLSVNWQISHTNISYWIRNFNLPLIYPSTYQKKGMGKEKPVIIIDELLLIDWWRKGYALIKEINPIDIKQYNMLTNIRNCIYKNWIPSVAISDALCLTHLHVAELITKGKVVNPIFRYRCSAFLEREKVYNWIKNNYGNKQAWYIANYEWSIK